MTFQILPAGEEDSQTLAEIESIANVESNKNRGKRNLSQVVFGPPNPTSQEFRARGLREKLQSDPYNRVWKAVVTDDNGNEKIVAWANWHFFTEPQPIEWKTLDFPAPVNSEGANAFISSATALRAKYMTGKRFAYLSVLATLPEYRFKGLGSALVRTGLDEAAAAGLADFWLEASEDGHGLYEKFGFVDQDCLMFDLEKYGGIGQAKVMMMRRLSN